MITRSRHIDRSLSMNAGVTLIELTIALFVIVLVFAGVYGMSSQVTRIVSQARGETRATEAAQLEIERLRAMTWDAIASLGSGYTINADNNAALASLPQCNGTVTIAPFPATNAMATVRSITVTVRWQDAMGDGQSNILSTLIAQHGINR